MEPPERRPARHVPTVAEIGAIIQEARLAHRWTQAELARRAQVSRRWIGALESGQAAGAEFGRVLAVLSALGLHLVLSPPSVNEGTAEPFDPAQRIPDRPAEPTGNSPEPFLDLDAYLTTFNAGDPALGHDPGTGRDTSPTPPEGSH